jgi:hypothetical protein
MQTTNLLCLCTPSSHLFEKYLPTPLLFSLTDRNSRDASEAGGARLIPRRAFSFVSPTPPLPCARAASTLFYRNFV